MFLRFAYAHLAPFLIPLLIICALVRLRFTRTTQYRFPLTSTMILQNMGIRSHYKIILYLLRLTIITLLTFFIMRPQWVDERSKVHIDGVDIIITLDVSNSMMVFDDEKDQRTRIDVAKSEAIRFIEKRHNDPIGVVIFGNEVLSRCPLTLDKSMLKEIVGTLELGIINPQGTWLGTGLATAVNRLKNSQAKSKIIILLTDGEPTPNEKIKPDLAVQLAQKQGIKVYTIGIGNEDGGFINHPFGLQRVQQSLNHTLLQSIADQTGGKFFKANNPTEMRNVYETIDALEKTKLETNIFSRYYEAFKHLLWIVVALFMLELVLRLFIWRGV